MVDRLKYETIFSVLVFKISVGLFGIEGIPKVGKCPFTEVSGLIEIMISLNDLYKNKLLSSVSSSLISKLP
jgi:hypothetical protein